MMTGLHAGCCMTHMLTGFIGHARHGCMLECQPDSPATCVGACIAAVTLRNSAEHCVVAAVHETTSEHTDEMLDFLEQQSRHLQIHPAEHPSGLYDAHAALKPARAPAPALPPPQPASMAKRSAAPQRAAAIPDTSAAAGGSSAQSASSAQPAGSAEPVRHSVVEAASAPPGGRSLKDQAEQIGDSAPSSSAEGHRKQRKRSLQI